MKNVSFYFFAFAALCVTIGMAWGIQMAATHDHSLSGAHAHLNLVGWVTMGLFGLYYAVTPTARQAKLALVHFWIAVAGVVTLVPGIAIAVTTQADSPLAIIGSILSLASMLIFLFTVARNGIGDAA